MDPLMAFPFPIHGIQYPLLIPRCSGWMKFRKALVLFNPNRYNHSAGSIGFDFWIISTAGDQSKPVVIIGSIQHIEVIGRCLEDFAHHVFIGIPIGMDDDLITPFKFVDL